MRRLLFLLILGMVIAGPLVSHDALIPRAAAQEDDDDGDTSSAETWSGPGFYFDMFKMLGAWLLFCLWVHTTDWASRDGQEMELNFFRWNPILFGSFMVGFLLMFFIPIFWLGFPILVVSYAVPMVLYVRYRNARVEPHQSVMTAAHLRYWFAVHLAPLGIKIDKEVADPHTTGSPVILVAQGTSSQQDQIHLVAARQSPGFFSARQVVAEGLFRRADAIMLEYAQEAVGIRHLVDGIWHNAESWEREAADPVGEAFKLLCGLNHEDRVNRQSGTFAAEYLSEKYSGTLTSQGTETGERILLKFEGKKTYFDEYESLGMRPKMQEDIQKVMGNKTGFVLFTGAPASGLRSTMTVALTKTDRFMRELVTLEDEKNRYEEIENVHPVLYKSADGQSPDQLLEDVFHKEPNVVVVRDLVNGKTAQMVCQEAASERLLIGSIRSKDGCEGLLRLIAMGVPPAELAKAISAVVGQRLIRKLCDQCKQAYPPTSQMLAQLKIPEGRVQAFYRPPTAEEVEEVCANCSGIGYVGRTAIFELLLANDQLRKALATKPKLDQLRQVARQSGMRTFQEEGVVLVAKGITSLEELTRVLKQ